MAQAETVGEAATTTGDMPQHRRIGPPYAIKYPRRRLVRYTLRTLAGLAIRLFGRLSVSGLENIPKSGPVVLAANHFAFIDPPLVLRASPRLVEFVGGARNPGAPGWTPSFPAMWGVIRAYRGTFSRSTLDQSIGVLEQGGVLGIFPEGGNWATVLRPARPGAAFIAIHTGAPIVPVSITGAVGFLGKQSRKASVTFHPAILPPSTTLTGRARRVALDAFGDEIMARIASGLPDADRGKFSSCPEARAAAEAVSAYPFDAPEMRGI
ncbi:MAG: lysophospholipid acyltransferase family protein [Pseudomonadota bacterium]